MRPEQNLAWRHAGVEARFSHAPVHGLLDFLEADVEKAHATYGRPPAVIEGH